IAFRHASIATVPVLTHWPYFAVWNAANFFANASAYLPGNGWPPHFRLVKASSSAANSSFVATGHGVKGVLRTGSPPVIASFPTCESPVTKLNLVDVCCACAAAAAGALRHDASGFAIKISRTTPSKSWHAVINCRKVRRVGAKESNSSTVNPPSVFAHRKSANFLESSATISARTGSSIRERTSLSLALTRTCHGKGGEI